jgi:hypothetical protein
MATKRQGYLGGSIIRPGNSPPPRVGNLTVSNIPRQVGIESHVAGVKRQNIVMDAATIVAATHGFVTPRTIVNVAPARYQNFAANGGMHAAHVVKTFIFDGKDISQVYARYNVDEVAQYGLKTMLGLVTDVEPRANLSIDRRLEGNPQRLAQIQFAVSHPSPTLREAKALATELELRRRTYESGLLKMLRELWC